MPNRLHRGAGYSHFITTSCYQRLPLLGSPHYRDLFLNVLEQVRRRYRFTVIGYVIMPEHVHLLLTEPERGNLSVVMQAIKQGFARRLLSRLRQQRPCATTFAVERPARTRPPLAGSLLRLRRLLREEAHREAALHSPQSVKRGLVLEPDQWPWSSYRQYAYGEAGPVVVNEPRRAEMQVRKIS